MKKTYHLCLSAPDEVLFRDLEDYHRGFNCFALALYKTDSTGLVESFMSTHTHQMAQTQCPKDLVYHFRRNYSLYFNHKYQREGRLGEMMHFSTEIVGYNHILAAMSYVLRNAVHHGVVPIPYAYPHSSANAIFREEMGKMQQTDLLSPKSYYRYIGKAVEYPERYKMHKSGVFLRESVLDIPQVEGLYGTPRAFNYFMTRKSSEEWIHEQTRDNVDLPSMTLESIEKGVSMQDLDKMLMFENGKANYRCVSDIDLCSEADFIARNMYGKHSVYQLTVQEQRRLAEDLYQKYKISPVRIRRCLVMK
ncbi:MAG: hypothetical protein J6Q12_00450 [Bacteroidales bacterium]|nr:hypothetical protein [Bacteroidales bacterium]